MKTLTLSFLSMLLPSLLSVVYAAPYKAVEVKDGGSITGKVSFTGKDPAPKLYKVAKDMDVCGTGERSIDFVKVSNGGLANVVVFLDKVNTGKAFDTKDQQAKIDQKGCEFKPFFQVMHNEATLEALNSDSVSHNIHTYELIGKAKRTVVNVSQPKQGSLIKKKIKMRRGNGMKVECDQHDFMHGFVYVAKNPYYAVVQDDGNFKIENVPPGKYSIKTWHGVLGEKKASVTVQAGQSATANFSYK